MTTLLLADLANGKLGEATAKALTAARALGGPVHILVAGTQASEAAQSAAMLEGVEKVLLADAEVFAHGLAEPLAALMVKLAGPYEAIVAAATTTGKNVMPRVAALLDVMQISEITKVISPDVFERPIYAGNAIQTVQSTDPKKVITIRTSTFAATGQGESASIEAIAPADYPQNSAFKGEALAVSDRPELTSAKIIVSGGRAMQSAENFKTYLEPMADRLGAAGVVLRAMSISRWANIPDVIPGVELHVIEADVPAPSASALGRVPEYLYAGYAAGLAHLRDRRAPVAEKRRLLSRRTAKAPAVLAGDVEPPR